MNKKREVTASILVLLVLLWLYIGSALAGNVSPATGGSAILATTAANACSPNWTTLSGPRYEESAQADLEQEQWSSTLRRVLNSTRRSWRPWY